jgi:hypothetical protein
MPRASSTGKCLLCGGTKGKVAMTKHVEGCLSKEGGTGERKRSAGSRVKSGLHIVIDCPGAPIFWLHARAPSDATLGDLDAFLRDTWLECCGHLSAFEIGGMRYETHPEDSFPPVESMDIPLGQVLVPGITFSHEYDLGTPTKLRLKIVSDYLGGIPSWPRGDIRLLARNDPPRPVCSLCDAPATKACPQCAYGGDPWVCGDCAPEHECGEDTLLPFVNSPRCGVCGYTGRD